MLVVRELIVNENDVTTITIKFRKGQTTQRKQIEFFFALISVFQTHHASDMPQIHFDQLAAMSRQHHVTSNNLLPLKNLQRDDVK